MAISETSLQAAKEAREKLLLAADALQSVIEDRMSLTDAARACGIGKRYPSQAMQNELIKAFQPYIKTQLKTIDDLAIGLESLRSPGDHLLLMIFGEDPQTMPHQKDSVTLLPGYDEDLLWDITANRLTPRENMVLRYLTGKETGKKLTSTELAKMYQVTGNRIGQIKAKALRKLRSPRVIQSIFPYMNVRKSQAFAKIEDNRQKAAIAYARARASARETKVLNRMAEEIIEDVALTEDEKQLADGMPGQPVPIGDARVSDWTAISSRLYNCLKRANIMTMNKVAVMPVVDILRIRNLGRKSLIELHDSVLYHFGFDRTDLLS